MRIRSRGFYDYLSDTGMLDGTPEQIDISRREYRRRYKKTWRQGRKTTKEVRIEFTLDQFAAIQQHANTSQLACTTFARNAILRAVGLEGDLKKSPKLLSALQLVSMAAIAAAKGSKSIQEIATMLEEAEQLMLSIINNIL